MNTARTLVFLVGTALSVLGESPPSPGTAQVTMSYPELRQILGEIESLRAAERERATVVPVPFVIHRIEFALVKEGDHAIGVLDADVENFSAAWQLVPLVRSGDLRLDSVESGSAQVIGSEEGSSLRVPPESIVHATLRFAVVAKALDPFELDCAAATIARLRIDADLQVAPVGEPLLETADGQRVYAIATRVRLESGESAADPEHPTLWQADAEIAVRLDDSRFAFDGLLHLRAEEGDGVRTVLALPRHARIVSVTGEGLAHWAQRKGGAATREIVVEWDPDGSLHRDLQIVWQMPQPPLGELWSLASPQIIPTTDENATVAIPALFALESITGVEFGAADGTRLPALQRLPSSLREKLPGGGAATVSTDGTPAVIRATWLPREKIAEAMVEAATFTQRLVADGALLTTAEYLIGHRDSLTWSLEVPAEGQLLSCSLNEETAQPIRRTADGPLEFALPALDQQGTSCVTLCYAGKLEKLDPVAGSTTLSLPRTDLFIHRLKWTLEMPAGYETTAAEGNVEIEPGDGSATSNGTGLHFHKDLCRGETPTLEVYYRKLD
jgi:hypothetical protein